MATVPEDIAAILRRLPPAQQQSVLAYARSLEQPSTVPVGAPMSTLLRFAGALPDDIIADMSQAIEAECERIEPGDDLSF
jgi:hypothetical protein